MKEAFRWFKQEAYLYEAPKDYHYQHPYLQGLKFTAPYVTIDNGKMTVHKGYASDGCTPRIRILGLFSIGVPNGPRRQNMPSTYLASLQHDVFCQYRHHLPLTKAQVIQMFDEQLRAANWPLRRLYVRAVDGYGPQDFGPPECIPPEPEIPPNKSYYEYQIPGK